MIGLNSMIKSHTHKQKHLRNAAVLLPLVLLLAANSTAAVTAAKKQSLGELSGRINDKTYRIRAAEYDAEIAEINNENTKTSLDYCKYLLRREREPQQAAEYALQAAKLERDAALTEFEAEQLKNGRDKEKALLNCELKSIFYDCVLLDLKADIASDRYAYAKRVYELKCVQLENGQTIENEVELAKADMQLAEGDCGYARQLAQSERRKIQLLLNDYSSVPIDIDGKLGASQTKLDISLAELKRNFREKNYDLLKLDAAIEADETYLKKLLELYGENSNVCRAAELELEKSKLNAKSAVENSCAMLEMKLVMYNAAAEKYSLYMQKASALEEKAEILSAKLDAGRISELEYLSAQLDIQVQLYEVTAAQTELLILSNELLLLMDGIMLS